MGKLITIEGIDGSGKETQSKLLFHHLLDLGQKVKLVSFPDYQSNSSALVKMYLEGDFGASADDVSAYQASVFFAADRYASYKMHWQEFYQQGGIVIADRYTTANMMHQGSKIADLGERARFLDWLKDFEYNVMELPRPDLTLFLDVNPDISNKLILNRTNKSNSSQQKDIHEKDELHLLNAYLAAKQLAAKDAWQEIDCLDGKELKAIDQIEAEIFQIVKDKIGDTHWK